jgi:hypothetical protein
MITRFTTVASLALALASTAMAEGITAKSGNQAVTAFDIVSTTISEKGDALIFSMAVSAAAGTAKPSVTGKLAGAEVYSYVWPTSLDSSAVGFEKAQGILALAATAHPDFDDTPQIDENGDGKTDNDGDLWHSHWVVLGPDEVCGKGALKVIDIPEGQKPKMPVTWPGLPLLIDSPNYSPAVDGSTVSISVPKAALGDVSGLKFDGVTAGLRVHASVHAPLLCVTAVWDVASGDLSLPGTIGK